MTERICRGLLSAALAGALFLSCCVPGSAAGATEEDTLPTITLTFPEETTVTEPTAPEETLPTEAAETTPETTMATIGETTAPTAPETTAATEETFPTEETLPPEEIPAEITLPAIAETAQPECSEDAAPVMVCSPPGWVGRKLYFGLLHAHTDISDGVGTVEEAFSQAAAVEELDFFAVTDHSNSFDNADEGAISLDGRAISAQWAAGKAAAAAVTDDSFVGIFGYEMTWQEDRGLGHINTFHTPGWQSRSQKEFSSLDAYYQALSTVPGSISQFNHPGSDYGEFENFAHHSAAYDKAMALLEVGGEGSFTAYRYYTRALDKGWHVAPTISSNEHNGNWGRCGQGRTVILADSLTEKSLYDAMAARRVYATEDRDLSVCFTLDGHEMGSITGAAGSHSIRLWLDDPTDTGACQVEVITRGGSVWASETYPEGLQTLEFSVSGGGDYYYLRITQPDGDIAVTAPVWTETYENAGISGFASDTQVPVSGSELTLTVTLFNDESVSMIPESVELFADGTLVDTVTEPGILPPVSTMDIPFPYSHNGLGSVRFRVVVTYSLGGANRSCDRELTLYYKPAVLQADILVETTHSGAARSNLDNLRTLAEQQNLEVDLLEEDIPKQGKLLIIPPPKSAFDQAFIEKIQTFSQQGGALVICGTAEDTLGSQELNRLLEAVGCSMRLRPDRALDAVHNGGTPDQLYPQIFNPEAALCRNIRQGQFYCHLCGCTVDPGDGTWLVKASPTACSSRDAVSQPVLLAGETLPSGAVVLAAGSFFLADDAMPLPKNNWELPRINQAVLESLLGMQRVTLPCTAIRDVRKGTEGTVYRIKGYATSGTANKYNTFPDTLYIQDDTGGIAVTSFRETGIQLGTPLEIVGCLDHQEGNPVLCLIDHLLPEEARYRYDPDTIALKKAMDYDTRGGSLIQVEGNVSSVTFTDDHLGVSRFTLTDPSGTKATVIISGEIRSGAYGTNTLATQVKPGRKVRAMGLLHKDANGVSVLRVRNCEEVVYVPPVPRPGENPYTGDRIFLSVWAAAASLALLIPLICLARKKQSL